MRNALEKFGSHFIHELDAPVIVALAIAIGFAAFMFAALLIVLGLALQWWQ